MFWWFTELYDPNAQKRWTASERRAAYGAWAVMAAFMVAIMLPLDYYLIFKLDLNDILSSALSGGAATMAGIAVSAFVSPKLWPVLAKPRTLDS